MPKPTNRPFTFDVVILGSGAAGLAAAIDLPAHLSVAILSKNAVGGSTPWAQGGIAAVVESTDSLEEHVQDTMIAGAGLCDEAAVRHTVNAGEDSIQWLLEQGTHFDESDGKFHLTREGGHSHRRVLHAADATGAEIHRALLAQAHSRSNLRFFDQRVAVDLIVDRSLARDQRRIQGVYAFHLGKNQVQTFAAKAVILATGGASKVYFYTSNPAGASGDGIAMAYRAGCRVANMEFNQFHPTCLHHPDAKSFLISEALRGEGGRLTLPDGEPFMHRHDSRGELAPRDVVARAIDFEMKRLGAQHLYLDISHKPAGFIRKHFPTIAVKCAEHGIDITREPIPVVPAAHYTCGGVMVDRNGATDIAGLYAAGEVSYTGLHGANRMASNSLLECIVWGRAAAHDIGRASLPAINLGAIKPWDDSQVKDSDEDVVVSHNWDEARRFMWDYVGIVRTDKRLLRALHRVNLLQSEIDEFYSNYHVTGNLLELRNLVQVAELMVRCALQRKESRGLHYSLDYPENTGAGAPTIIDPAA
ncbi:L-aspartate oxidase [Litorivicinus lipolyticus]|uniref:L-aspartate oxidase n=1 Tax=Litorivicinus lipolyticus TaxID=418701 RepID=A0A5Q2Q818_9GAMM|nr:L-aspartate oxidase [Litorivicinus lipolyticus]QGG80739.1 L-aspartate oxidase [Litorivicinus lipolyticus]